MLAALAAPRLTVVQRLYGLGLAHLVGRGGGLAALLWDKVGPCPHVSRNAVRLSAGVFRGISALYAASSTWGYQK